MQAKQEKGKQVQAQLSALRPLKTRLTVAQKAHEKANKKYKALAEEEESVKALLLAKQRFTKQAKDARDEKARELEAVEAEARIAREGNVQRPPTRSPSPMSPAQWAAGLQSAVDDDARESFNQWLDQYGAQAQQFLPQQLLAQMPAEVPLQPPVRSPQRATTQSATTPAGEAALSVETISIAMVPEWRFQPY